MPNLLARLPPAAWTGAAHIHVDLLFQGPMGDIGTSEKNLGKAFSGWSICPLPLEDGRFSEPPAHRGWLIVVEVAVGIGLVVLWRVRRNAPDPDWAA